MTSASPTATTTQVYRVYIKATPEAIWDAITKPEWTAALRLRRRSPSTTCAPARPTASTRARRWRRIPGVPDDIIDGEIIEADPPRRLVA